MSTLTRKGQETRARIVDASALLIREAGAGETSLDDIRAATATSKSQLFHYFPGGREDLLVAVAEHEAAQVLLAQQPWLDQLGPDEAWVRWHRAVIDHYVALGSRCPLGSLTTELGKTSPRSRQVITHLYDVWQSKLAAGIDRRPDSTTDAECGARAILAAIQGGVLMLRVTERVSYLQDALAVSLEALNIEA
ncbi:helix-turn-helix domain containing protein [Nocardioides sp. BP30]|uniref:TetR/AcrR family transcriptional regulator n=1 Tax=Nocardioides sp. BP30 TaxID=3036374 RepID=UPI002469C45E|nr:helix-turn-helix domain-containing protein [Nocardioides sp. BP30]WGL51423.1 helix-turn-helix domain containing protein [Nocardioides sp. BP30]